MTAVRDSARRPHNPGARAMSAGAAGIVVGVLVAGCTSGHPKAGAITSSAPAVSAPASGSQTPEAASSTTAPSNTTAPSSPASSSPAVTASPPTVMPAVTPSIPAVTPRATPSPTKNPTPTHPARTATATAPAPPAPAVPAVFQASATAVTAAELAKSWHAGCPVGPAQLRTLSLTYWGFDAQPHQGALVVSAAVVPAVTQVFRTLFAEHFPIRTMIPISAFGASDPASTAADNTASFNCRYAVANGPPQWSAHAYGEAIDINTVENPYVFNGQVLPPNATAYRVRSPYRPGMAVPGGQLVGAFAAVGWQWGGRWSTPDYQHFSSTGG
jgi:D-alanyl-D-alanine carboxypeptidase